MARGVPWPPWKEVEAALQEEQKLKSSNAIAELKSSTERSWPFPSYENIHSSQPMNDSDRRSPEDDPLACVEPTSAHRYFGVHLFRKDGRLGLRIDQQSGSLCVGDIKDGAPAAEWNHNCDLTFPDDKLEKGDLIIRVNGIGVGVGKSTNADDNDNGRTEILVAMWVELRNKQKEDYLLVVERKVTRGVPWPPWKEVEAELRPYENIQSSQPMNDSDSSGQDQEPLARGAVPPEAGRFQRPGPLPAPPPAPTVLTNILPPPPRHPPPQYPPPPHPPPPPSAIQSAPVQVPVVVRTLSCGRREFRW